MNKILSFKKIVSIGFFVAFLAVFLTVGTAQASFWDWFNLNKTNNDSQQAAAITNTKATSTTLTIKVISPNGGEVWKAGTKKNIVFKGNLIKEKVYLNLEWGGSGGGNVFIGESITSGNGKTSTYSWTIPATTEQRNDYKISARYPNFVPNDTVPAVIIDSSDKTFTIKSASSSSSKSSRSSSSKSSRSSRSKSSRSSATTTPSI